MNEVELKQDIINKLKARKEILNRYNSSLNEDLIRGFIMGAEEYADVGIPAHWYTEIVKKVQS